MAKKEPLTNEDLKELGLMLTATKIEDTERIKSIVLQLTKKLGMGTKQADNIIKSYVKE